MRPFFIATTLCFVCRCTAWGEASYQETTRITGGSITKMMSLAGAFSKSARKLGQPVVTTVAVKNNVMVRDSQDAAEIINLDARTITHIDKLKHEYTVTTFQQMQEALQQAAAKAQAERAKAPAQSSASAQQEGQPNDSNLQLTFKPTVRKTDAKRQIAGMDTSEVILSLAVSGSDKTTGEQAGAFAVTEDMWLAPRVQAYDEVREFSQKLAGELGSQFRTSGADLSGLMAAQKVQSDQAFKELAKEMRQIEGVPILQVMRMGMTANGQPLPAASEVSSATTTAGSSNNPASPDSSLGPEVATASTTAAQQTAAQEASQKIKGALGSGLGSAVGGFGGFGGFGSRKKKQQQTATQTAAADSPTAQASTAPASPSQSGQDQLQSAVLVESTTELSNFSQQADERLFQIPSGFRMLPGTDARN